METENKHRHTCPDKPPLTSHYPPATFSLATFHQPQASGETAVRVFDQIDSLRYISMYYFMNYDSDLLIPAHASSLPLFSFI